ncbi:MAG: HDOD domain-containing protein [Verrucomicrobiota bacterium]
MSAETEAAFFESLFPPEVNTEFREKLLDVLQHDPEFPSFPAAIAQLQEKLNTADTSFEDIAEIVRLDPGLTGRIFSLIRSAAFAGVEVFTIENALFRLGLRETRNVILTAKLMGRFAHLKVEIDWNRFWLHSLLVARLTQGIADIFYPSSYKHYIGGLLHDVGKVILAYYFPELFDEILQRTWETGHPMYEIEQAIIGTDHAAIGTALGYKWGLDEETLAGIQFHHNPEQQFLTYCLNVADIIANRYAANINCKSIPEMPATLETGESRMDNIVSIEEWKKFHHLKPRRVPSLIIQEECLKACDIVAAMLGVHDAEGT